MKGFDTKALVLFPAYADYEDKSGGWKRKLEQSVDNIRKYFKSIGVEVHFLYTDDVARELKKYADIWVSPISKADRFFTSKHCLNMEDAMRIPMVEFPDMYDEIARKDMVESTATELERFEMVNRHCKAACVKIIPQYKIVVHFMKKSRTQYKVATKPGDGKIRINVDIDSLVPTAFMSGYELDMCDVTGTNYANRALCNWEVPDELPK